MGGVWWGGWGGGQGADTVFGGLEVDEEVGMEGGVVGREWGAWEVREGKGGGEGRE